MWSPYKLTMNTDVNTMLILLFIGSRGLKIAN